MSAPVKPGDLVRIPGSRYFRGEYRVVAVREAGVAGPNAWHTTIEVDVGRVDGKLLTAERWEVVCAG